MAVTSIAQSLQIATITIKGVSPLLYGKQLNTEKFPKKNKETYDSYEKRTWKERCHYDEKERLYVPAFALKRMLESASRYNGERIKGGGMKTQAGKLKCGIQVSGKMTITPETLLKDVGGHWQSVSSTGKTGGGTRVHKCLPLLQSWGGTFEVMLMDEQIQKEWIEKAVIQGGIINGLGTWRPQNGGSYGRFSVTDITWRELDH